MYCSISEAWNEENTMSSLAKRFNTEYFSNNSDLNTNYYRINSNNFNDTKEYFNQNSDIKKAVDDNIKTSSEKVISVNNNLVPSNVEVKKKDNKHKEDKKIKLDNFSCNELIDKVLSCDRCRKIIKKRLGVEYFSLDIFSNLFKNTNKEIIILILIGLIIIIMLDLFIKISNSLN